MAIKTEHTAAGVSTQLASQGAMLYYVDFTSGSGAGTAQFEVLGEDDRWLVLDKVTGDTGVKTHLGGDLDSSQFRWNISTYTSGTITTYMAN